MTVNQTMWSAMLPGGEIRSGTLEQLNEALQSGHLSGGTLVRASGSNQWATLAEILEAVARGAPVAAPAPSFPPSAPPPSVAPPQPSTRVNGAPELWQVRLADGQVRSGTREQLEEAFRAGHLSENMLVLAGGAPEWVPLGASMRRSEPPPAPVAAPPPAPVQSAPPAVPAPSIATPSGGDEIWQVRLADGQVRSGTRLQLEEAFRAGHLDGNALVLAAGASEWVPLYALAGRLSSAPQPAPAAEAQPAPVVASPAVPAEVQQAPVVASPAAPAEAQSTPVVASPVAPAEAQSTPVVASPVAPAEAQPAAAVAPPAAPVEGPPQPPAAASPEEQWQVQLTYGQLQEAVRAGLLGHDSRVLAVGTEEWIRLGDLLDAGGSDSP